MRNTILFFIISLILVCAALAGCTKTEIRYVCVNGGEPVIAKEMCKTNKIAEVEKREAEDYAQNYVKGYFAPYGGKVQMVSTYLNTADSDYYATFIVSVRDGAPRETIVVVDSITGQVRCNETCDYVTVSE
ncbi:hypothetical protein KY362_07945 [Candidatus Woesearchaeota archaeon]|nr:hypothetical protein [Candidatus Woesearchaeota archaeon]